MAIRHYDKTITDRTSTISETQTETIQLLNDTRLNERQRNSLKGTYELMLKAASDQAKKIKCERDQNSEKKLSDAPPTKRRRLDEEERYDVHICTHVNKIYTSYETTDPGHQGESLIRDPTDLIKQTIETKLDNLYKSGLLTKRQYEFCYPPESHRTSLMYFLIKLHKNSHTYRPICSCVNSITANISGFLDFWLKQAVVLLPTYKRDTTHLIQTLEKQTFCKDIILCTVDVTNMYTNIPTAEGNQAALRALTTLKKSTPMPDMAVLADLLDIVTKNNVFEFNGEFYLQTRGVPMGNIMAPSYSGIFMGELEQKIIQPYTDKIKLWIRYIDDILILWSGNQEEFQSFLLNCNKLHPTIKFTRECSPNKIHFLDVTIYKGTNFQNKQTLDTKTYTKPTNKQTYVHSSSFHPKGTGKSIALGEAHRILRTNSDEGNFRQQILKLQKALLARGYKEKATKTLLKKIYFKDRERVIHKQNLKIDKQGTPVMAITYNTHVPLVRDALRKLWVDVKRDPVLSGLFPAPPRIALKKNRSLRDMLVRARLKKETPLGFNPPC